MKIRKSRRNEYKIISICGFLIIVFCLLIEDMMKKFPDFFSNTSIKITVGVLCFGVLLIAILLTIRLFILVVNDYKEKRKP